MVDLVDPHNGENIARKRGNLGINAGDAAAVNVEFMFPPSTYRTVERNCRWSKQFYSNCEYDELLCYMKSM